jgi:hypothetical protein
MFKDDCRAALNIVKMLIYIFGIVYYIKRLEPSRYPAIEKEYALI